MITGEADIHGQARGTAPRRRRRSPVFLGDSLPSGSGGGYPDSTSLTLRFLDGLPAPLSGDVGGVVSIERTGVLGDIFELRTLPLLVVRT